MTAMQSVNKHLKFELTSEQDAFEWYIIDPQEKKPTGPLSVRDIEVMWETNTINSQTFVWKNGMTDWQRICQIEELKSKIEEDTYVPFSNKITTPIPQAQSTSKIAKPEPEKPSKVEENLTVADMHRKRFEELNPSTGDELDELETLEDKFKKLQKKIYKGPDGLWYVYQEDTKSWKSQVEDPGFTLGEDLFEDLIQNMDSDHTAVKKKANKAVKEQDLVDLDTLTEEELVKKKSLDYLIEKI